MINDFKHPGPILVARLVQPLQLVQTTSCFQLGVLVIVAPESPSTWYGSDDGGPAWPLMTAIAGFQFSSYAWRPIQRAFQ